MDSRKALDGRAVLLMLVLCLIWGLQQSVLKLAASDIAPIMQIALRSGIAALLVGLLMVGRKEAFSLAEGTWRAGLAVGFLFALEFLLVSGALRFTSASQTAVFLYTAPIFAALGLHWTLPAERLKLLQWLGIALAFGGIVVAFLGRTPQNIPSEAATHIVLGDVLALLGGVSWAATTVVIRCTNLAKASASQTLLYQLVAAFVLLLLAATVMGQTTIRPTPLTWGSLVFQSLIVSFASFLVWFWLLKKYLASELGVFSFLTPIFGVAFGVWLLDESLEPSFAGGAALVLAGVLLVNTHGWIRSHLTRWASQR
jgi:drug/metabolite transporter (DMT)-like permease